MSFTNNIGSLQQIVSSIATGEIKGSQQTSAAEKSTPATTSPSASAVSSDRANLSSTSSVLAQALSADDVRTEKVAALQQAIASGTYNVSSSEVAGKLIQSLLK
jgi:negative regulator of flagellin synthesis FlgM